MRALTLIMWNLRKVKHWSKSILTFDQKPETRRHSLAFGDYLFTRVSPKILQSEA